MCVCVCVQYFAVTELGAFKMTWFVEHWHLRPHVQSCQ